MTRKRTVLSSLLEKRRKDWGRTKTYPEEVSRVVHILTGYVAEGDAAQANVGSGKEEIAVPQEKEDDGMEEGGIGDGG